MKSLSEMTDRELQDEIVNCDSFDQDGKASSLFLELLRRYKELKEQSQDYSEI